MQPIFKGSQKYPIPRTNAVVRPMLRVLTYWYRIPSTAKNAEQLMVSVRRAIQAGVFETTQRSPGAWVLA